MKYVLISCFDFLLHPYFNMFIYFVTTNYPLKGHLAGIGISQSLHLLPHYNDKINVLVVYMLSLRQTQYMFS